MAPPERPRRAPGSGPKRPTSGAPRRGPAASGGKPPFRRREDEDEKKRPYQRRDDRGAPSGERKPYQRRDDRGAPSGERKPYQRRDERGAPSGERKPYQRREVVPAPLPKSERKSWGGVTRRGARQILNPTEMSDEAKAYEKREGFARPTSARPEVDRWERKERPAPAAKQPKKAPKGKPIRSKSLPADVVAEVASASGNNRRAPMLQRRLSEAARHVQQGRDKEAAAILRPLAQEVPEAASVRELYAQALYGLGRFRAAAPEFEAFIDLTNSTDQHPMLADCYRALGRHKKVHELWLELRESSPAPDIVAEGRIVMAGSLADQKKLDEAIALLESAPPVRGRVAERHLRTWFALADLYERSGELSKSRALFERIQKTDPDFVDVAERLHGLG